MRISDWSSDVCSSDLDVGDGIDAVQLAGGDDGGEERPVLCADLVTGEQGVLARQGDGTDRVLDRIGVEFEAAVLEEPGEARPVAEGIADVAGEGCAGRDRRQLRLEPRSEERRGGKECVGTCRSRGSPYH